MHPKSTVRSPGKGGKTGREIAIARRNNICTNEGQPLANARNSLIFIHFMSYPKFFTTYFTDSLLKIVTIPERWGRVIYWWPLAMTYTRTCIRYVWSKLRTNCKVESTLIVYKQCLQLGVLIEVTRSLDQRKLIH